MSSLMPSQQWLLSVLRKLFLNVRKTVGRSVLNRLSLLLWTALHKIWSKLRPTTSHNTGSSTTHESTNNAIGRIQNDLLTPLNLVNNNSIHKDTTPLYASSIPTSASVPSNAFLHPGPSNANNQASRSSHELGIRHSLSAVDLEDSFSRRLSSPSAPSGLPSISVGIPNPNRRSYHGREPSPHPSQYSHRSHRSLYPPTTRASSRASSRSRRTNFNATTPLQPWDRRPKPNPYKDIPGGVASIGSRAPTPDFPRPPFSQQYGDDSASSGVPTKPNTPLHGPLPELDDRVEPGMEFAIHPASPRTNSPDRLSVLDQRLVSSDCLRKVNIMFVPISPEQLFRYDRREPVPDKSVPRKIAPLNITFDKRPVPEGWEKYIHPEGTNCFYNREKRIWTDNNLFSSEKLDQVEDFAEQYHDFLRSRDIDLETSTDTVMDVYPYDETGELMCCYYLVNHEKRSVFWLDDFNVEDFSLWYEVTGIAEESHLGLLNEWLYWEHASMFPMSRDKYALEDIQMCRSLLIQAWNDNMTSLTSTFPLTPDECESYLKMTEHLRNDILANDRLPPVNSSFAPSRIMNDLVKSRYMNFYGEPGVRLNRDQSIHMSGPRTHTWFITFMRPILFRAPDAYLSMLEQVYVDGMTHSQSWKAMIATMNHEWQEITLFATVLLNANVGFLTIDNVQGEELSDRTITQVISYLSTFTSIGSIIIGLLLIRMNRDHAGKDASQALTFIQAREHRTLGLEILAMLYSMPFALLMWGMVLFLAAFSLMCLLDTPHFVQISVSTIWCFLILLLLWALYVTWDRHDNKHISPITMFFKRLREHSSVEPEQQDGVDESISSAPLPENTSEKVAEGELPTTATPTTPKKSRQRWTWGSVDLRNMAKKFSMDSEKTAV